MLNKSGQCSSMTELHELLQNTAKGLLTAPNLIHTVSFKKKRKLAKYEHSNTN